MEKEGLNPLDSALDTAREKLEGAVEALTEQAYNELVAIRRGKLAELQESGSDPFERTSWPQTHFAAQVKAAFVDPPEGERGPDVCMAGRMMSKRVMGKASFADLRDASGDIQMYVRRDDVGVDDYQAFKKFDIGDPHKNGRDQRTCIRDRTAGQKPAAPAGKIPRPARPRGALPPALCGSDRQPGREGYVP